MDDLSITELADKCREELDRFKKTGEATEPSFCYELFRRALEYDEQEAYKEIFEIFSPRIKWQMRNHRFFYEIDADSELLTVVAFGNFFVAIRKRGIDKFAYLGAFLNYLKLCASSAIMQERRREIKNRSLIPLGPDAVDPPDHNSQTNETRIEFESIWKQIVEVFSEKDLLLIRLFYIEDLKPADIADLHASEWATSKKVSDNLYRIRKTLRNHPNLGGSLSTR